MKWLNTVGCSMENRTAILAQETAYVKFRCEVNRTERGSIEIILVSLPDSKIQK